MEKYFKCLFCRKELKCKFSLDKHTRSFHPDKFSLQPKLKINRATGFICYFCAKLIQYYSDLLAHIKIHTKEKGYNCHFLGCKKMYSDYSGLQLHKRVCNFNPIPFVKPSNRTISCYFCHQKFYCDSSLHSHLNIHTREKSCRCKRCGQTFIKRNKLTKHIQLSHTTPKSYKCNVCGILQSSQRNLNRHIAYKHTKDHRIQKCYFCHSRFEYITREHMAMHTKEYLYFCKKCPEEFRSNQTLKLHYLRCH